MYKTDVKNNLKNMFFNLPKFKISIHQTIESNCHLVDCVSVGRYVLNQGISGLI